MPLHALVRRVRGLGDGRLFIFNRSDDWITERIVEPWNRGDFMVLNGEHWNPREVQVTIFESNDDVDHSGRSVQAWNAMVKNGVARTDDFLKEPAGAAATSDVVELATDRRAVMVVHGRNDVIRKSMFELLRAIDLRPLEWSELVGAASTGAPYIGDVLDEAFARAQAVIVLSTPDDFAFLRSDLVPEGDPESETVLKAQARPNVFFEAGMAMGRFPKRTVLAEIGQMRPASDLLGRHSIRLNEGPECRQDLAKRLSEAGCEVNTNGTDWLSTGVFELPPDPSDLSFNQGGTDTELVRRIDALVADLGHSPYATWLHGGVFNELAERSEIKGIPRAEQMLPGAPELSRMTTSSMRMLLNQVKAQL
jgi:predicted nucleotide-binding protein